nr:MAG TPA: hypothetical protein [Inoviridae sp.]
MKITRPWRNNSDIKPRTKRNEKCVNHLYISLTLQLNHSIKR